MSKRYFIKTYGCQMNKNDSEVLAGMLESLGYEEIGELGNCDIILVNTCTVREHAENKAYGFISSLKKFKIQNPKSKIGICGCTSQQEKSNLLTKFPFVDFVLGPNSLHELPKILTNGKLQLAVEELCNPALRELPAKREISTSAWISIIYGCNNFCSFCIVPYVRGREVSRPKENIIREIKELDKSIFKEVVLLGQNVNSYGKGLGARDQGLGLADLLKEVSLVSGVERIRFLTSHPRDISDEIINAVKDLPKVCEYFHLPLQSGDDEILKLMNRGYTSDYYRKLIDKIRKKIPEAAITSDVVVGFPGESEAAFENTIKMIEEIQFDLVNTAAYSDRPGTVASKMGGKLPNNIKQERLQQIMKVVEETARAVNQRLVGKVVEVLVDGAKAQILIGRTRTNKVVKFTGTKDLVGRLINVRINKAGSWVLEGEVSP